MKSVYMILWFIAITNEQQTNKRTDKHTDHISSTVDGDQATESGATVEVGVLSGDLLGCDHLITVAVTEVIPARVTPQIDKIPEDDTYVGSRNSGG